MFRQPSTTESPAAAAREEGRRFLEARGLDRTLPQRMSRRPDGRPYPLIQLAVPGAGDGSRPNVVEQFQLLQMPEPAGGWEAVVHANQAACLREAIEALEQRVVAGSLKSSVRLLLEGLIQATAEEKRALEARRQQIEADYTAVQEKLRRWQAEQAPSQDLLSAVWHVARAWLSSSISGSEAVRLWNERERQVKARDEHRAASAVLAQFAEAVAAIRDSLDALLEQAGGAAERARAEAQAVAATLGRSQRCGYEVDPAAIVEALDDGPGDPALLAELFATAREGGAERLLERARAIARREAERRLAGYPDIVSLLELEGRQLAAAGLAPEGFDPLILVGEELLDRVRRRYPSWQLVARARPRVETLQIVPDGAAVFEHPGLARASYGANGDRLGFLEVQSEVALGELRLVRDGAAVFEQALAGREYFILEEVAEAWQVRGDGDGREGERE